MTGFLHERELSRTSFLKGGGALIVGFSLAGAGLARRAAAAADPHPYTSFGPYDSNQIDSWLTVNADNTASVKLGKVELGQGSMTGLLMVAAEELNLDIAQMRAITNDTDLTPNQGTTAGSASISTGGKQTRAAAAAAYQALLGLASTRLGVPASSLSVSKGVVSGGGKTVTYGELLGGKLFNVSMGPQYNLAPSQPPSPSVAQSVASTGSGSSQGLAAAEVLPTPPFVPAPGQGLSPGAPGTKPVGQYGLVGVAPGPGRVDIPDKVTGKYTYVQNIRVPGMLHGRVVRPRGQGAYGDGTDPKVLSVDASSIRHIPNAKVLQKGNFVGVVAPREYDAIQAAAQLKVRWAEMPPLPSSGNLWRQMREQDSAGLVRAAKVVEVGNVDAALASAAHVVQQTYTYPYNGHLPIGPSCAVADVTKSGARVFSNSQNIYSTRSSIAAVLKLPLNQVRVSYYEGSSVFGNAPYDDCAEAAAVMSQLAGAPVRLQFMRWDEHGWDNYGPAQMTDVRGGVDGNGNIVATETTIFGIPWYTTKPTETMIGYAQVFSQTAQFDTTNDGTQYNLRNRRVIGKSLPVQNNYFKTIWLRAPAAPQTTFAYEQMIDELAYAAKMDPYQFRLQNIATLASDESNGLTALTWDRWKGVLMKAAQLANWQPKVAASKLGTGNVVTGRGIALGAFAGTPVAVVADIQVNKKTGVITVKHVYGSQDAGLTINPASVENQMAGGMVQMVSRTLFEQVRMGTKGVTSLDWVTYPIMRFRQAPAVTTVVVQRADLPSTGSGEPASAPIAAAIANAFFDATGVRMRSVPMTPARVRAVLAAA
jgi:CO/xanthine dehydrogenase Mo-binding subunit